MNESQNAGCTCKKMTTKLSVLILIVGTLISIAVGYMVAYAAKSAVDYILSLSEYTAGHHGLHMMLHTLSAAAIIVFAFHLRKKIVAAHEAKKDMELLA